MTCPDCERYKQSASMWRNKAYELGGTPLPWEPEELLRKEYERGFIDGMQKQMPEQEPDDLTIAYMSGVYDGKKQRTWVGLTDEEIGAILEDPTIAEKHQGNWLVLPYSYARAVEAKLKEKNT